MRAAEVSHSAFCRPHLGGICLMDLFMTNIIGRPLPASRRNNQAESGAATCFYLCIYLSERKPWARRRIIHSFSSEGLSSPPQPGGNSPLSFDSLCKICASHRSGPEASTASCFSLPSHAEALTSATRTLQAVASRHFWLFRGGGGGHSFIYLLLTRDSATRLWLCRGPIEAVFSQGHEAI